MTDNEPGEPITVEFYSNQAGQSWPTAFTWRGKRYQIEDVGRQEEAIFGGQTGRLVMVMTPAKEAFELWQDKGTGQWYLRRAWRRRAYV